MDSLIAVREVRAPVIRNCGGVRDRCFDTPEADLDWLEVAIAAERAVAHGQWPRTDSEAGR